MATNMENHRSDEMFSEYFEKIFSVLATCPDFAKKVVEFGCTRTKFMEHGADENQLRFVDTLIGIDEQRSDLNLLYKSLPFEQNEENFKLRDFKLNVEFYSAKDFLFDPRILAGTTTVVALDYWNTLDEEELVSFFHLVCMAIRPKVIFLTIPLNTDPAVENKKFSERLSEVNQDEFIYEIAEQYEHYHLQCSDVIEIVDVNGVVQKRSQFAILELDTDSQDDEMDIDELSANPNDYHLVSKVEYYGRSSKIAK